MLAEPPSPNTAKLRRPTLPRSSRLLMVVLIAWGCTTAEPGLLPLGFGPRATAEQALGKRRESPQAHVEAPAIDESAQEANAPPIDTVRDAAPPPANPTVAVESTGSAAVPEVSAPPNASVPPAAVSDWVGLWHGQDTTRFHLSGYPDQPMQDNDAKIRVAASGTDQIEFTLIDSSNDRDLCSLTASVAASEAHIEAGQSCFGTDDDSAPLSAQVKTGLATLRQGELAVELNLDATVESGDFTTTGSIDYHFTGRR
jgi:hypothetical protein